MLLVDKSIIAIHGYLTLSNYVPTSTKYCGKLKVCSVSCRPESPSVDRARYLTFRTVARFTEDRRRQVHFQLLNSTLAPCVSLQFPTRATTTRSNHGRPNNLRNGVEETGDACAKLHFLGGLLTPVVPAILRPGRSTNISGPSSVAPISSSRTLKGKACKSTAMQISPGGYLTSAAAPPPCLTIYK